MTFSTATIQGKVMWIGGNDKQGKEKNRTTASMLIAVPDKRSKDENGNYTRSTTYQVRVWDSQAIAALNYIEKFQTITCNGNITGIDNYKPDNLKINMDFATILDYGYKQTTKPKEGTAVFTGKEMMEKLTSAGAKKALIKA